MRIIGYGICGKDEQYIEKTLDCFKKLCDETIICLNNSNHKDLIESYGFKTIEDNREWGKLQWEIKEDFFINHVLPLNPDWCVALDMDEVMETNRDTLEGYNKGAGYYCYIQNLIDNGYSKSYSFWNIRYFNASINPNWEQKALHCGLAPRDAYLYGNYAPIIVKHYGLNTKESRDAKIKRYEKYDPNAEFKGKAYYEWLKSPDVHKLTNKQIEVDAFVKGTHFKEYKPMKKENKYYYVKTIDGRIVDIPAINLQDEINRGSVVISKEPIIKTRGAVGTTMTEVKPEEIEEVKEKVKEEVKPKKRVRRVKKNV